MKKLFFVLLVFTVMIMSSCKKDDNPVTNNNPPPAANKQTYHRYINKSLSPYSSLVDTINSVIPESPLTQEVSNIKIFVDTLLCSNTGDIEMTLIHQNTYDTLIYKIGTGQNFLGTIFCDSSSVSISSGSPPFSGQFRPQSPLSQFNGQDPNGLWFLRIYNNGTNRSGVIKSWGITVTYKLQTLPANGLVTYYPFNGNANDSSGNGNNGTVYNATLTTDRFGKQNQAYYFNGTDAYIKASANVLPATTRTISIWFYANSVTSRPALLGYGGGICGTSFFAGIYTNSDSYWTSCHCGAKSVNLNITSQPVGQWINWIITSSLTGTRYYINGTLVRDTAVFYDNTDVTGKDFSLGVDVDYLGFAPFTNSDVGYFDGKLDDIRIYNRELSQTEINTLYHEGGW
jgi:hypothetical protein